MTSHSTVKIKWSIFLLLTLLAVSNVFWFLVNEGAQDIIESIQSENTKLADALVQSIYLLPKFEIGDKKIHVMKVINEKGSWGVPDEHKGVVYVGYLSLHFNDENELLEVENYW